MNRERTKVTLNAAAGDIEVSPTHSASEYKELTPAEIDMLIEKEQTQSDMERVWVLAITSSLSRPTSMTSESGFIDNCAKRADMVVEQWAKRFRPHDPTPLLPHEKVLVFLLTPTELPGNLTGVWRNQARFKWWWLMMVTFSGVVGKTGK